MTDLSLVFERWLVQRFLSFRWVKKRLWLQIFVLDEVLNHLGA